MTRNKWLSRRFIATTWAALMASIIVLTKQKEFIDLALMCAGIVALWAGGETWLKKVYKDKEN